MNWSVSPVRADFRKKGEGRRPKEKRQPEGESFAGHLARMAAYTVQPRQDGFARGGGRPPGGPVAEQEAQALWLWIEQVNREIAGMLKAKTE